eukprot:9980662-Lingulodinium_polyedra.AAC.1
MTRTQRSAACARPGVWTWWPAARRRQRGVPEDMEMDHEDFAAMVVARARGRGSWAIGQSASAGSSSRR